MAALKVVVPAGPDPAVGKVVRWCIVDLGRWVEERWGVSYSETGMLRLLWALDLSHREARPRHPQSSEKAQQGIKKILWATDGRARVGFGVQHPTQETANGDLV